MLYLPLNSLRTGSEHAMAIRILLADDAAVMRRMIRELIEAQPELKVVGEAGDFSQTMRMASDLRPDVVVMDLHMPSGIRTAPADIKAHMEVCGSKLLAISIWNDPDSTALAEDFGAVRLLQKMELGEVLVPAILQLVLPGTA